MTTYLTWLALPPKLIAARVLPTYGAGTRAVGSCHWKVHWKRIFQTYVGSAEPDARSNTARTKFNAHHLGDLPSYSGTVLIYDGTERLDSKCSMAPFIWLCLPYGDITAHLAQITYHPRYKAVFLFSSY